MRPELKKVIGVFGVWILMAIAGLMLLPEDWKWLMWAPIALIVVALGASLIGILLMRLGFFRPTVAIVNHSRVKSCLSCPARYLKDNPFSKDLPICKCKDKGMRTCYSPLKVPRWCPHAVR